MTERPNIERVARASPNLVDEQIAKLRALFPDTVRQGKVDFDKLRATLGQQIENGPERFTFSWAGKRDAITLLQTPSAATLIPVPEDSVNFDRTGHVFVEGENLEVLKLLHRGYAGRVKMIYIDPPYNTGSDEFIYRDNFAAPLEAYLVQTGQRAANGDALTSKVEKAGRLHSDWLSMMYPRLFMARQMLREDGVIFISIDDNEVHNLRQLMNEVFGEENFVATVIWQKVFAPKNTARHFSEDHDYVVVYAKNAETWTPIPLARSEEATARYENPDNDPRGPWSSSDLTARNYYSEGQYEVTSPSGKNFRPSIGTYWRVKKAKFLKMDEDRRIWWGAKGGNMPRLKRFLSEVKSGVVPQTLWKYQDVGHTQEAKQELLEFVPFEDTDNVLDTVKPTRLIQRMLHLATAPDEEAIVMDFFAGSGTTGHAVLRQNREDGGNRRFVLVQLPSPLPKPEKRLKTIADIARTRIGHAIDRLQTDREGNLDLDNGNGPEDLGMRVLRLAPSNYAPWTGSAEKDPTLLVEAMKQHLDPLLPGWKTHDVIWEVAIKEGYALDSRVEKADIKNTGNIVYRVTDGGRGQSFLICLDDKLKAAVARELNLGKDDLFICRDCVLDDELAANLALQCRLKTI